MPSSNRAANDEWHTDDDKAWEAEMNDPDRGLVDAFGVKPDFVVGSPDAIPNSAAEPEVTRGRDESMIPTFDGWDDEPGHATRNRAAELASHLRGLAGLIDKRDETAFQASTTAIREAAELLDG